jgi:hypothetical protein
MNYVSVFSHVLWLKDRAEAKLKAMTETPLRDRVKVTYEK